MSMSLPYFRRMQHLQHFLLAAGVLLILVIVAATLSSIMWLRDKTIHEEEVQLSQLTVVIAEQVERTLESVDGVLQVTVDRVANADLGDPEARAAIHTYLYQQERNLTQTFRFIVFNQDGDRVVDSQSPTPLPQNNAMSETFQHFRDSADPNVYLSAPVKSRQTGDWFFSLARHRSDGKGAFAGYITASIDLSYFTNVFESIQMNNSATISFARDDGIRMFRYPVLESAFGDSLKDTAIFSTYLPDTKAGVIRGHSRSIGDVRISSFRALKNYPVVITVNSSLDEVLAPWRKQAWVIGAIGLGAIGILSVIGSILIQLARRGDALLVTAQEARKCAEQSMEAAEQASRVKSEFLAGVSHELRTPLNSIIGFSEVLLSSPAGALSDQQREYTQYINTAGTHLLSLINDLLDHAKIEANRLTIIDDKFALHGVINECLRLVIIQAESRCVKLAPYDSRQFGLRADPIRIRQIIFNLLSNAIKFTPENGTVEVRSQLAADGSLIVSVADTGIGMTEQEIAIALEPYGQVVNSMTRNRDGTGLGMPLVLALVKLHGGQVAIDSTPGKGTTVSVTLPGDRVLLIDDATRAT